MGKTIMLSALIQTNLSSDDLDEIDSDPDPAPVAKARQLKLNNAFRPVARRKTQPLRRPSATLIVAPTSLLNQWSEEIQRSSKPGTIKVLVWHGQNRLDLDAAVDDDQENDKTIKVVITSYGVLASEHAKPERPGSAKSPIFESGSSAHARPICTHGCSF